MPRLGATACQYRNLRRRGSSGTSELRIDSSRELDRERVENADLSQFALPAGTRLTIPTEAKERKRFIKLSGVFYEIGLLLQRSTKPTYEQMEVILTERRNKKDYPLNYPYTSSSLQRYCRRGLPVLFQRVCGLDFAPELFHTIGSRKSNCGLSPTGMHIWMLTRDCLRSERLPPFAG